MRRGSYSLRAELTMIALAGLVIRVIYTLAFGRDDNPSSAFGDAAFFHIVANLVAGGHGFSHPFYWVADHYAAPTAAHPPLWPLLLSVFSKLGATGQTAHRLVGDVVGCGVVFATGLLGARAGGRGTALVAAGLAAVYPILIAADGSVMSEPLCALTVVLALLAAYRYADLPSPGRAAALGTAIGLAALTRGEALALVVLLALPIAWIASSDIRGGGYGRIARDLAVVVITALVVLAPWTIRNAIVFDRFVPISTNVGTVVAGANCGPAYNGRYTGGWIPPCVTAAATPPRDGRAYNEAALASRWFGAGRRYAQDHAGRLAAVLPIRLLRTWSLWQPRFQATAYEGENRGFAKLAVPTFFPIALLALVGAFAIRRRRRDIVVLLAAPAMVTLSSLAGYGTYRFRHAAEPALVVLAALALRRRNNPARETTG